MLGKKTLTTLCFFLIGAAAALYGDARMRTPSDTVNVYIGAGVNGHPYTSEDPRMPAAYGEGERDSLLRLSQELRRHPRQTHFIIRRGKGWQFFPDEMNRAWTEYDRKSGRLIDYMLGGNCNANWLGVTDDAIHGVATHSGTFADLAHYGCRDVHP